MEFARTDEQRLLLDTVRGFATTEVAPQVAALDARSEFPADELRAAAELGLLGMAVPEDLGGTDLDPLSMALVYEEIAAASGSLAVILAVHNSLVCEAIRCYGSQDQGERFLPGLASGQTLGAYALTEAGAGSDAGALQTRADRDGDAYVLNGGKLFITSAEHANLFVVFARTDAEDRPSRAITAFLVARGLPGFSIGKKERKLGLRSSEINEIAFADVRVPVENRLGDEGRGFGIALALLDNGRVGIAAQAVGMTRAALERSLAYAKERRQFGRRIADHQAIQWMLADMATNLEAARLLTHRAATLKGAGAPFGLAASQAKLFASRVAVEAADAAVQIHGGYGYLEEYGVERLYRDAKATELYEGTSEIQRLVIARHLLGDR